MEIRDIFYVGTILVGALAAVFSDRWQNKQNQKDIEELKKNTVSIDDYKQDIENLKDENKSQWIRIDEGKKWEIEHEKEAWKNRNSLELKIAELHGADQKLEQMLLSIENKLDGLIERLGR